MTVRYRFVSEGVGLDGIPETSFEITYDDPENEDYLYGGEKGEAFPCHYDDESAVHDAIIKAVIDATEKLPPGTVFDIRTKLDPVLNETFVVGRSPKSRDEIAADFGVAWYSLSSKASRFQEQQLQPLNFDYKNAPRNSLLGGKLLGVMKTPGKQGG
jgi:hypothetical protein